MTWNELHAGPLGAAANLPGIDANLVWADASGWRDFLRPGQAAKKLIPVIAEIEPGSAPAFADSVSKAGGSIPPVYRSDRTTHCTGMLTAAHCADLLQAAGGGGPVRRFELQAPLVPQRPRVPPEAPGPAPPREESEKAPGRLLVGVIDHGCPFAHQHLRRGSDGTRILNLWLQDETLPARTRRLGATPSEFGYGVALSRSVLDKLMQRHITSDGFVDEEACYAEAGMDELRQRFLHGAAVLDLFVGPRPLKARTSNDPDRPPTWAIQRNQAELADIVFVQLPRDMVQDSTSAGLTRSILDGLQYILGCAGPATNRVVVNISDGSSRGSHDGESIIEKAMASLLAEQARRNRQVVLVLPAGNSHDEERHAQFDGLPAREWRSLRLRLPPACEAPSQLVIRLPTAIADAEIRVVPPGQDPDGRERDVVSQGEAKAWPDAKAPACAVIFPAPGRQETTEALVTWAPTERFAKGVVRAPPGDWRIEVRSKSGSNEAVHFYVARNQTNPDALFRGRQAFFIDEGAYDPDRYQRARDDDPDPPQSPIRRRGSLNSLATAPSGDGVVVVGSAFLRERMRAGYSSEGPAAGGQPVRRHPDFFAPTELSSGIPGIVGSGTIGGQVVRVRGTSFAAPQVARALANDQGEIVQFLRGS
jgi:hypothetical protein